MVSFSVGQHVMWHYQPAGGLGYEISIQAQIIKIGKTKIQIEVPKPSGELVRRWVIPSNLTPHDIASAQDSPKSVIRAEEHRQPKQSATGLKTTKHSGLGTSDGTHTFPGKEGLKFATRLQLPEDASKRNRKRKAIHPPEQTRTLSEEQLRQEAAWQQVKETGKPVIYEGTLLIPDGMSLWDAIELLPDDIRDQTREVAQAGMARIVLKMINRTRDRVRDYAEETGDLEEWNSFPYAAQMAIAESVFRQQFGWPEKPLEELIEIYSGTTAHRRPRNTPSNRAK